jgi:hypothetical protein
LAAEKEKYFVEYALGNLNNQIFISKYQLYLPDRELLIKKLNQLLSEDE